MKATGIVRRIDDLGRIVIPKEIRRTMHIKDGDPLEIFVGSGEIVFKKYSLMGEFESLAIGFAETLYKDLGMPVAICDLEHVMAISGIPKKEVEGKGNSHALAVLMKNRETFLFDGEKVMYPIDGLDRSAHIIIPVICGGDILGAVVVFESSDGNRLPVDIDVRLAKFTAGLIAKQAESE